jgi:hypothetical protein
MMAVEVFETRQRVMALGRRCEWLRRQPFRTGIEPTIRGSERESAQAG